MHAYRSPERDRVYHTPILDATTGCPSVRATHLDALHELLLSHQVHSMPPFLAIMTRLETIVVRMRVHLSRRSAAKQTLWRLFFR